MNQRTTEWLEVTKQGKLQYHERQYREPYRSTVAFCEWLEQIGVISRDRASRILDLGCGEGANIYYMSRRFPKCQFLGIDLNPSLVKWGNEYFNSLSVQNGSLQVGNLYSLDRSFDSAFDGLVCFQTLSWLPDFETPLKKMIETNPKWIALTSLFFDGQVNCKIEIQDYTTPLAGKAFKETYYNVYSVGLVKELLATTGYTRFHYKKFEIDIDLPKPQSNGMGTYTEKLEDGSRIQISGPLLMNWGFIVAVR